MNKEEVFTQKATRGYLVCYNDHCPLHQQCLRYDVGQYKPAKELSIRVVNPCYEHAGDGQCPLYRPNEVQRMPVGMKKFFYLDMPVRIARRVRNRLIDHNCRSTYYQYHNGKRPITPDLLAFIKQVCREEGWTQPLVFDGETEGYAW